MAQYDPRELIRHGFLDDQSQTVARQHLAASHRLYLQATELRDGQ